jgi:uncharacterized protein YdeI (YjbR/CyaY-like superfamily)
VTPDPRIDAYIARAAPFAAPILEHVRTLVHNICPAVEEAIKWGAPAFVYQGKILLVMAAFKSHAALNFWRGEEVAATGTSGNAMGQFGRIASLEQLPDDAELAALIRNAVALIDAGPAPRKPKHPPKHPAEVPAELVAALSENPAAQATFDGFPPSARRDYADWIAEAKRPETRAKRVADAVTWLAEGKRRNWKYEKC